MGKMYDISAKLTNKKPTIKIAEGKIYEVDNRKNTVLKINQMMQDTDMDDIDFLDDAIKLFLGEEAVKELDKMDLSIANYQTIFMAIMAAIQEVELEEAEEMFR